MTYQYYLEREKDQAGLAVKLIPPSQLRVEKSNSSYGNWVVRFSPIHLHFTWKKKDAQAWIDQARK